jgi:hypothetical protein
MITCKFSGGVQHGLIRDMFKEGVSDKTRFVATAANADRSEIDVSYLPAASEMYNISPNISDYILVPVSTVLSDLPNTNGDAMTREELLKFNPQQGRIAYKTWIGKPTFLEHANQVIPGAKGIILDTYVKALPQYGGLLSLIKLLAFDRSKDPRLVNEILRKAINTYSMGVNFSAYRCSVSGRVFTSKDKPGDYTDLGMPPRLIRMGDRDVVAYRQLLNLEGFETSAVGTPAYFCAIGDTVMNLSSSQLFSN